MSRQADSLRAAIAAIMAMAVLPGCGPVDSGGGLLDDEQVLSSSPTSPAAAEPILETEANDDFATAQPVHLDAAVELIGTIAGGVGVLDTDVYNLGPVAAGDRILVEATVDSNGDVVLGLFDADGALFAHTDLSYAASYSRFIDVTARESSDALFVVVATRYGTGLPVDYSATVEIRRDAGVPATKPQSVVLHFDGGGDVTIANRGPFTVPPFDAAHIESRFGPQTQEIIDALYAKVLDDYAGLNVSIHLDGDPDVPADALSHVYFGTYDPALLGLADNVDAFNADPTQTAIIYTDTFALFKNLRPTVDEIAQALANVASHEIGHLIGLRHTADPNDVMDITATASQMLVDQWFRTADMNPSVIPVGSQDSPALLSWTVGGAVLSPPSSKAVLANQRAARIATQGQDVYIPRSMLMTCSHGDHDEEAGDHAESDPPTPR